MRRASEVRCNLPRGATPPRCARAALPADQEFSAELVAEIDAKWAEVGAAACGFPDYAALEAALRRPRAFSDKCETRKGLKTRARTVRPSSPCVAAGRP